MKKRLFFGAAMLLLIFSAGDIYCATYDLTGTWNYTLSDNWAEGSVDCSPGPAASGTCVIEQTGDTFTFVLTSGVVCSPPESCTLEGTVNGAVYTASTTDIVDDENGSITTTINFTAQSPAAASGSGISKYTHPSGLWACNWGNTLTLTRSETLMSQAAYPFEEGDKPTGSVDLGGGVTVTFAGDIEVGIIDNRLGFFLGKKPVQSLTAAAAEQATAGSLSFTLEEPIKSFTVRAADFEGNTTISAYDSGNQLVETVQVKGSTSETYELAGEQSIAKVVISSSSGWAGTTEELAVISGQVSSQLSGSPLQGVTVTLTPTGRQTTSDPNGNYTLTGIKPGTYTLTGTGTDIETVTVTGLSVSAGSSVTQNLLATVTQGESGDPEAGYALTGELWAKAVLKVSASPVALVWQEVGADLTPSGDQVVSGYFYADPDDFAYGSRYNPELFVKIYVTVGGWCNIAFNHVTVDPVTVYSAHRFSGTADQTGLATLDSRLVQHTYSQVAIDTGKQSSGGASGTAGTAGYDLGASLWSKAVLQVAGSPVTLVWKAVGTDTTPSGAKVVSGYFYADPADFAYGSVYNPEVFVKVYIDPNGWANMAFNHVTVDPVSIDSALQYTGASQQSGRVTLDGRLLQHSYTGVSVQ